MRLLWQAGFIADLVLVFAIIPFTLFFYEADSDFSLFQKIKSAVIWTLICMIFIGLLVGILYALVGFVVYPTQRLQSGTLPLEALGNLNGSYGVVNMTNLVCIPVATINGTKPLIRQCDATAPVQDITNWRLRCSIVVYIMAIQSILGWILFLVFAGVGFLAAPIDWIQQFLGRPTSVISKSEYIRRARIIAQRAKAVVDMTASLKRQDKDRKWRSNVKRLEREVLQIEEDEYQLERVFPQGEDGDVRWVLFMLGFFVTGFFGVAGIVISLAWLVHIAVYMLPPLPIYPMLNNLLIVLDNAFSLLGVAAFAGLCLYLMIIAIKGNFMLGLNFVVVKLYPMRPGATMMSSLLVNSAVILLMAPALLQFASQAFAAYASNADIYDVFGNQVSYLIGISWLYNKNFFLYAMYAFVGLSIIIMVFRGKQTWGRKRDKFEAYASS
mmetsp:Transcript_21904/g.37447  ORF Transcript_21904/g.37447 Transcript_21904/m.37447 type:complete len:440 (-) Transcript_21904:1453-2772(-)